MLILTRKFGESITIGEDIKITILDSKGKYIRVGIEAPRNIAVYRQEINDLIKENNKPQGNNFHSIEVPGVK